MITFSARVWLAIAAFSLIAAEVYFLATGGEDGGAVTLLFIGAGALVLAAAGIATNDGDAALEGDDATEPVVVRSALPAIWPALGAIGAGVTIVGYAAGGLLLYVGFGILIATLIEWMVQGWAERTSGDPEFNTALRNRIMYPLEVPIAGLGALALVILTFSRVLLAVPKNGSIIVAGVVATLIVAGAFVIASRPKITSGALSWLLAVGAVALLAAGVVGGVSGERSIEGHGHEGAESEEHTTTTGAPTP